MIVKKVKESGFSILNEAGVIQYQWTGENISCIDCPIPVFSPINDEKYALIITDENNCVANTTFTIRVNKVRGLFVSNAFSPNGDGNNDYLSVFGPPGSKVLEFKIFDRWGTLFFRQQDSSSNDITKGWDGRYKGEILDAGNYLWLTTLRYLDGIEIIHTGDVVLVK